MKIETRKYIAEELLGDDCYHIKFKETRIGDFPFSYIGDVCLDCGNPVGHPKNREFNTPKDVHDIMMALMERNDLWFRFIHWVIRTHFEKRPRMVPGLVLTAESVGWLFSKSGKFCEYVGEFLEVHELMAVRKVKKKDEVKQVPIPRNRKRKSTVRERSER